MSVSTCVCYVFISGERAIIIHTRGFGESTPDMGLLTVLFEKHYKKV